MRIAIVVILAFLVTSRGHCQFSERNKSTRRMYVQIGFQYGVVLNSTKIAKAYAIGWYVGLAYKIYEDLRLEVNWAPVGIATVIKQEHFPDKADRYDFEPGGLFSGTGISLKYMAHLDRPGDKNTWYASIGINVLHSVYEPKNFYAIYKDSASYIEAKGKLMTSFVAPFIEFGDYFKNRKRPTAGNIGAHLGLRYTFIPVIYHGSYHSEIDGTARDGTVIMSRGYFSVVFNYPIGKTWDNTARKEFKSAYRFHGHHRKQKKSQRKLPTERKIIDG